MVTDASIRQSQVNFQQGMEDMHAHAGGGNSSPFDVMALLREQTPQRNDGPRQPGQTPQVAPRADAGPAAGGDGVANSLIFSGSDILGTKSAFSLAQMGIGSNRSSEAAFGTLTLTDQGRDVASTASRQMADERFEQMTQGNGRQPEPVTLASVNDNTPSITPVEDTTNRNNNTLAA